MGRVSGGAGSGWPVSARWRAGVFGAAACGAVPRWPTVGNVMTRTRELPSERRPALWRRTVVRPTPPPTNLPKWFVGDWNRVIRDPLDVLRLAPLIGALVTIVLG